MIRKLRGHRVRLRPVADRVDDRGRQLPPIDDVWWVLDAEGPAGLVLSNWRTGHRGILPADHIRSYATDPEGRQRGFLVLNSQMILGGQRLALEPLLDRRAPIGTGAQGQGSGAGQGRDLGLLLLGIRRWQR